MSKNKFIKNEVNKETSVKEESLQNSIFEIIKVEEDAIIVKVDGWRMRVYFDRDAAKETFSIGQKIGIKHRGDVKNPHEIKFEKLK